MFLSETTTTGFFSLAPWIVFFPVMVGLFTPVVPVPLVSFSCALGVVRIADTFRPPQGSPDNCPCGR